MATILTFSTPDDPRRATSRPDAPAEVIVFPRTDVRVLRRLSDMGVEVPVCGDRPATAPADDA